MLFLVIPRDQPRRGRVCDAPRKRPESKRSGDRARGWCGLQRPSSLGGAKPRPLARACAGRVMGVTSKRVPCGYPGAGTGRAVRSSTDPIGRCVPGSGAQQDALEKSRKARAVPAVFAILERAYPRPKIASQNAGKHGWAAKQRLRDSPARSVRGGRAAQGPPSIRVPLNRGDTQADVPTESVVGTSKGRHDEPAQATSPAQPTAPSFGCGSIRESGADQSIDRHRRRAHRGRGNGGCRNNRRDGAAWWMRRPRQGL